MNHYIGIDVGTGSTRACIINENGDIVGLATKDIGLWQPQTHYYEQSTNDIWRCVCEAVKGALTQNKIEPASIKGIGFDATCSLAVFREDTDEPVSVTGPGFNTNDHNVILWLDHRAVDETKKINATGHSLLKYVGGTMSIEMEMPKILWLKNNMSPNVFAQCKFYDLTDALVHMATGNETRSNCSAVCKQGYVPIGVDGSTQGWQQDFLEKIGLEDLCANNFKRLGGVHGVNGAYMSAGELAGHLTDKAAENLGLPAGIPIGSGVIDAYAGWIGTVGAKVKLPTQEVGTRLAAVAGTSTCHLVLSQDPVFVNGVWGPYRDCAIPGLWMAEGGQSATGELLKHVLETHPAYHTALTEAGSMNIYAWLNKMLHAKQVPSIPYIGRHFFYYGDLFGNRSPVADPAMTGSVIGLTADRSVDNLVLTYYGAMEFIALQTRHIITTMNEAGHKIGSIFMSGSQSQNDILMSLIATACDMPVVLPRYVHAAVCLGAAMLGAKAASADANGKTSDLWSIMDRMTKPGDIVMPMEDKATKALLDVKYTIFLEQCQRQREFRRMVDEVLERKY